MPDAPASNIVANTWMRPPEPPRSMPSTADIVIIGGGIVGVSAAWFLSRQGIDVVLCEKGHIAGEQSGRNWGWVRKQGRDSREMPLIIESLRIWESLADETGEDVGFVRGGCLYMARSEREFDDLSSWLATAGEFGVDTRMLEASELSGLVRGAATTWRGAMYTPSDGRAEPHKAAPAIARAAAQNGASILTACAVRGIETEAGRLASVVTEHGVIRTSVVLCAAGAWTSMFCRSLGITLPQLKVRGTVARTAAAPDVIDGALYDERIAIRRRQDGGYTLADGLVLDHAITPATLRFARQFLPALKMQFRSLRLSIGREFVEELRQPASWQLDRPSPFEEQRVLDPEPNPRVLANIRRNLDAVFPALADIEVVETWAGMIEMTPDAVPVIDESSDLRGFYVATGFSGHGFGIGPGAGKAIAGMLTGNDSGIDLGDFRLDRFFDGTPIRPQSAI